MCILTAAFFTRNDSRVSKTRTRWYAERAICTAPPDWAVTLRQSGSVLDIVIEHADVFHAKVSLIGANGEYLHNKFMRVSHKQQEIEFTSIPHFTQRNSRMMLPAVVLLIPYATRVPRRSGAMHSAGVGERTRGELLLDAVQQAPVAGAARALVCEPLLRVCSHNHGFTSSTAGGTATSWKHLF